MQCRPTAIQLLGVVFLIMVFLVGSVYGAGLLSSPSPPVIVRMAGCVGLGMFAFGIPPLWPFFSNKPVLVLDEYGICDARLGLGIVPWGDIASVSAAFVKGRPLIQLWVRDENAYRRRLSFGRRIVCRVNTMFGYSPFLINLSFLTPGYDSVYAYISRYVPPTSDT